MDQDDERMDDVEALLRALDHPTPAVTAESVAARARGRGGPPPIRWAAAVFLTLGAAGAAFALPGSPLPRWAAAARILLEGRPRTPAPRAEPVVRESQGIAVAPGRDLVVVFVSPSAGELARVALSDRPEVTVRASAGAASFTTEADRLLVEDGAVGDTFSVEIPRLAPRVEIRSGATRLLLAERGRVTTEVKPDSAGIYPLELGAR